MRNLLPFLFFISSAALFGQVDSTKPYLLVEDSTQMFTTIGNSGAAEMMYYEKSVPFVRLQQAYR